jgi:plasmid stabilization system protein ParE
MAEVRWTPQALDDLEAVCLFIARDAPSVADVFAQRAFDATERLAEFPESGRIVSEMNDPQLREIMFGNYRLIYRLRSSDVEILTVHHGARLINPNRIPSGK